MGCLQSLLQCCGLLVDGPRVLHLHTRQPCAYVHPLDRCWPHPQTHTQPRNYTRKHTHSGLPPPVGSCVTPSRCCPSPPHTHNHTNTHNDTQPQVCRHQLGAARPRADARLARRLGGPPAAGGAVSRAHEPGAAAHRRSGGEVGPPPGALTVTVCAIHLCCWLRDGCVCLCVMCS